jgi:2-amino-4-hydroxy-6-hydroxymethyldihydropteridine diphosphokinase
MTVRAYLALGSNMGDRQKHLRQAIEALDAKPGIAVLALSAVYETDPVGFTDQGAFLNMVAAVRTDLTPPQLLAEALQTEQELGRVRTIRWGPRIIDIDILLYGEQRIQLENLVIPHPAMTERAFVLVPLRDVWTGKELPFTGKTIDEYLAVAEDYKGVRKWGTIDWATGSAPSGN